MRAAFWLSRSWSLSGLATTHHRASSYFARTVFLISCAMLCVCCGLVWGAAQSKRCLTETPRRWPRDRQACKVSSQVAFLKLLSLSLKPFEPTRAASFVASWPIRAARVFASQPTRVATSIGFQPVAVNNCCMVVVLTTLVLAFLTAAPKTSTRLTSLVGRLLRRAARSASLCHWSRSVL